MQKMKIEPHSLDASVSLGGTDQTLVFEQYRDGGVWKRVEIHLDTPYWIDAIAAELHKQVKKGEAYWAGRRDALLTGE